MAEVVERLSSKSRQQGHVRVGYAAACEDGQVGCGRDGGDLLHRHGRGFDGDFAGNGSKGPFVAPHVGISEVLKA